MTEFRADKMSLFIFLLLQFTAAVTRQYSFRVVVRDGGEVTLPCKNEIHHQNNCDGTSWLFNRQSSSEQLVTLGKIQENPKSDRLSVTENCSLVIKKVTVEDVGFYTCRASGYDTYVYLFLITIIEQENRDKKTVSCSMSAYGACEFTMSWLYEGKAVAEVKDMKTSQSECSVTVTFPASYFKHKSKYHESFKCKVRHPEDREDQQFSFSPEKPGKEATTATTTTTLTGRTTLTARASEDSNKTRSDSTEPAKNEWWLYIVAAGGAAFVVLVMIIVVVIRCKRTKGKKAQMDENTEEPLNPAVAESAPEPSLDTADLDDGVSYASVSYIKRTNKAMVKNDDDDEGDTVTYSTVRASSSAASAACDDPSSLYAAIKKPSK